MNLVARTRVPAAFRPGQATSWLDPTPINLPPLDRTFAFRLAMLTWVASATKAADAALHGLVGIIPLFGLALVVSIFEGSFMTICNNILHNGKRNGLMVVLVSWYGFGVFWKMYFWGAAECDWRGVMDPIVLSLALLMGFGFMQEHRCSRIFQIALIVGVGLQSIFAGRVMLEDPTLSRAAWSEMQGRWAYGDQSGFALQAILLPILTWRALAESGMLRCLLVAGCAAIGFAVIVCQFTTATALLAASIPIAGLLALAFGQRRFVKAFPIAIYLFVMGICGVLLVRDTALVATTITKIERLVEDPTSGGYAQKEAKSYSRWNLAEQSFETFCQSPIFGGGAGGIRSMEAAKVVGQHSSFFDTLGFYGLLGGGGAYIGLVLTLFVRAVQRLHNLRNWQAITATTGTLLFLVAGIVNPYWEPSIAMLLLTAGLFRTGGDGV